MFFIDNIDFRLIKGYSTHVDALQVIWQLERIAFDRVMLGQFGRYVVIANHEKIVTLISCKQWPTSRNYK